MRIHTRLGGWLLGLGLLATSCSRGGSDTDRTNPAAQPDLGAGGAGSDLAVEVFGVTAVTPSAGPPEGGTVLRMRGARFTTGASVQIGGRAALQVQVVSASELTAVLPPAAPGVRGLVPVTVSLPAGPSVTRADLFRYTSSELSFAAPAYYPIAAGSIRLLAQDLNRDGLADLLVAGDEIRVFLGRRDGSLQAAASPGVPAEDSFAVGDLNSDGLVDVVFSDTLRVGVMLGKGDGTFLPARFLATERSVGVALVDLNRDEKLDLVISNYAMDENDYVEVLLGRGDGSFGPPARFGTGKRPHEIEVLDADQDGRPDLALALYGETHVGLLLGNGDGSLQPMRRLPSLTRSVDITSGDLNGDGKADLVLSSENRDQAAVHLGNGDGTFAPFQTVQVAPAGTLSSYKLALVDLNSDTVLDLAVCGAGRERTLEVLLGNGDGSFRASSGFSTGLHIMDVTAGDLNGDGRPDLVLTRSDVLASARITVLLNTTSKP